MTQPFSTAGEIATLRAIRTEVFGVDPNRFLARIAQHLPAAVVELEDVACLIAYVNVEDHESGLAVRVDPPEATRFNTGRLAWSLSLVDCGVYRHEIAQVARDATALGLATAIRDAIVQAGGEYFDV